METFGKLTSLAGDLLYTWILIPLLLGLGIYFTFKIKAGQISNIGHAMDLITAKPKDENAISPFKAFTISAASHIGTGNVVGVAAAISVGGPGAVFWMWITALIGGASAFVENTLGQIFKEKNDDGSFKGGPAFYINKTIKKPGLANLFSIIVCIVYGFMFNAMQSNTIASGFSNSFDSTPWVIGLIVVVVSGFVIFGGLKRISDITSLLVPVMAIAYIGLVIFILITNITKVPYMFGLIFKDAFNLQAGLGGLFGTAVLNGVKRGLFSNEAGMGAVPNASAVADVSHPAKQGLIQALGVYLDTILICSATAFVIIIGGEEIYLNPNLKGLDITQAALAAEIGPWAQHFLTICVLMFAFSSIIGNYYYGENNILVMGLGKTGLTIYRILVLAFVFFGSVGDFSTVWNTGDIFMGIMAIINLFILMIIGKCAVATYYDYKRQLKEGKDPVFNPRNITELSPYLDDITAWDD
ncbi:alanine/glycine:cation symporter family protein [Anaerococcus cruorum]|uniref:alanine/glycine:cation symporter family protein n=1 Tax=Anaerococcus sp. WGS1529 TaxID=3366812 RepID=UPI00372D421B